MKIEIVRAQVEHCEPIAARVREADRAELWATCCLNPYQALIRSWGISDHSWTALFDGEPACMFGVTQGSILADSGRPWMVATDLVDRYPLSFIKEQKPFMTHIRRSYAYLENYVDARNTRSIRWLKWLGFDMAEPTPYGPLRVPFRRFTMERSKCLS